MRRNLATALPTFVLALASGCAQGPTSRAPGAGETAESTPPALLVCRGNEPFWNVEITPQGTTLATPSSGGPVPVAGNLSPTGASAWTLEGESPIGTLRLDLEQARCLDSMADHVPPAPYRAMLNLQNGARGPGCCWTERPPSESETARSEPPGARAEDNDWSAHLQALMPAIRACLSVTPGPGPRVTKAWPNSDGTVGVRTRNTVAGWYQCTAPSTDDQPAQIETLTPATARLSGEGTVVFTALPGSPPLGHCYQHELALSEAGEQIGWLSFDTC